MEADPFHVLPHAGLDDVPAVVTAMAQRQSFDVNALGLYNAERARGIVHTSEWRERMAAMQECFDRVHNACWGCGQPLDALVLVDGLGHKFHDEGCVPASPPGPIARLLARVRA